MVSNLGMIMNIAPYKYVIIIIIIIIITMITYKNM